MRLVDADELIKRVDNDTYIWEHRKNHVRCMIQTAPTVDAVPSSLLDQSTKRCEALRKQLREAHESYEKHLNELEAQLPKHGEWITDYDGFEFDVRCSVCGEEALIKEGGSHDHAYSKYCPTCGASMDGKE